MIQMQITLPEKIVEAVRSEASQCGITPNVLARIRLCSLFFENEAGTGKKSYIVPLENWKEAEAYIKERGFGGMGIFLNKAAEWYMRKYHLSAAQKASADKNIKERKKAPADASAGALRGD
jgi:hypothetical protein